MIIQLDHIAILTTSLEQSVKQLPSSFPPERIEEQPKEGTREQYVNWPAGAGPSLLFMQPIQDGPYQGALEKRGPGLHHLGCVTDHLDDAIEYFAKHGLLLHPISLTTYSKHTVWMCRPGIPFLLELYQSSGLISKNESEVLIDLPHSSIIMSSVDFIPQTIVRAADISQIKISAGSQSVDIISGL